MVRGAAERRGGEDAFARLHRQFLEHFGYAVVLAWAAAGAAATQAPWLRNIRGLMDADGRTESTLSYLFALPAIMALGWVALAAAPDAIRRAQVARNPAVEFAVAGAVAMGVFCLAVARAVTAASLG